jgi:hypothetical protein
MTRKDKRSVVKERGHPFGIWVFSLRLGLDELRDELQDELQDDTVASSLLFSLSTLLKTNVQSALSSAGMFSCR